MVDKPASSESSRERSLDESVFKSLIENSLDAIFITDQQGRFSYVNQVATQVFGYEQNTEMVGLPATANWLLRQS